MIVMYCDRCGKVTQNNLYKFKPGHKAVHLPNGGNANMAVNVLINFHPLKDLNREVEEEVLCSKCAAEALHAYVREFFHD